MGTRETADATGDDPGKAPPRSQSEPEDLSTPSRRTRVAVRTVASREGHTETRSRTDAQPACPLRHHRRRQPALRRRRRGGRPRDRRLRRALLPPAAAAGGRHGRRVAGRRPVLLRLVARARPRAPARVGGVPGRGVGAAARARRGQAPGHRPVDAGHGAGRHRAWPASWRAWLAGLRGRAGARAARARPGPAAGGGRARRWSRRRRRRPRPPPPGTPLRAVAPAWGLHVCCRVPWDVVERAPSRRAQLRPGRHRPAGPPRLAHAGADAAARHAGGVGHQPGGLRRRGRPGGALDGRGHGHAGRARHRPRDAAVAQPADAVVRHRPGRAGARAPAGRGGGRGGGGRARPGAGRRRPARSGGRA